MVNKFVEIEFKGNRKAFYLNDQEYPLNVRDYVIVQADKGIDLGRIYKLYEEIPCHAGKTDISFNVLRLGSKNELQLRDKNREEERPARIFARELVKKHELEMKISTVEYQLDRKKITFYFTADERVDFRELIKDLARKFKARIELRQIGAREEARMIGGCGSCGSVLCCTLFNNFEPISSQAAKDQMLTTNMSKLTGMCGRLKCCLKYEQPMYLEELSKYPPLESTVKSSKGRGVVQKIDIFRGSLLVRYEDNIIEKLTLEDLIPAK